MSAPQNVTDVEAQRHADLLQAIRTKGWSSTRVADVQEFSREVDAFVTARVEAQFGSLMLAKLYFQHMPHRVESIPEAYEQTFGWLFAETAPQSNDLRWNSFTEWAAKENASTYWITGKPGSGKSTLMKFIYGHRQLPFLLNSWAQRDNLAMAGFYFWNSGSDMQMSRLGCFQTLLRSCFEQYHDLITTAFPERWNQYQAFREGLEDFDWPELRRAFQNVISVRTKRFFFLIDGLDEFDGEPKEVIRIITDAAQPNVKLCVSSRPWLPFEDAFGEAPSLRLENLTRPDILRYINGHFLSNRHFVRWKLVTGPKASDFLSKIADKAQGVFLWVYLVVDSLLQGLSDADSENHLEARLDALPSELGALFDKILSRLGPEHFKEACETFRLLRSHRGLFPGDPEVTLLNLYYADDSDTKSSIGAPCLQLTGEITVARIETMRRRLSARCKGFLEFHKCQDLAVVKHDLQVSYLHRTARDFIESGDCWPRVLQKTGGKLLDTTGRWVNAKLWMLKAHPSPRYQWNPHDRIVEVMFTTSNEKVPKTWLDSYLNARFSYENEGAEDILAYKVLKHMHDNIPFEYIMLCFIEATPAERTRALAVTYTYEDSLSEDLIALRGYYDKPKEDSLAWNYRVKKLFGRATSREWRPVLVPYE